MKQEKIKNRIIIGDLHLKLETKEYLNVLFDQIVEAVPSGRYDVVFLGDIYDGKAIIRSEIQNYLVNFLQTRVLNNPLFDNLIFLVGNHDLENLSKTENSLKILKNLSDVDKIKIVDKPILIDKSLYVPYLKDQSKFKKIIDSFQPYEYLFCHQAISGFKYNNFGTCTDGADPVIKAKKVFAGHFHKPQESDNIIYVGSTWSNTFNEANEQKRFFVFKDSKLQEYQIDGLPQHRIFEFNMPEDETKPIDFKPDDKVKIIIKGKKSCLKTLSEGKFGKECFPTAQFQYIYDTERPSFTIDESLTPTDMFDKYIDYNKETFGDIDIKTLKKAGKKYIKNFMGD